jgi:hypothetical protein
VDIRTIHEDLLSVDFDKCITDENGNAGGDVFAFAFDQVTGEAEGGDDGREVLTFMFLGLFQGVPFDDRQIIYSRLVAATVAKGVHGVLAVSTSAKEILDMVRYNPPPPPPNPCCYALTYIMLYSTGTSPHIAPQGYFIIETAW